jgi:hypothetical protein
MTKYENIIKQKAQNKEPADIDALAKRYKMDVIDVKKLKDKILKLEEDLHSKEYWEKPDYKFLVNENLNLRRKITEHEQEILEVKADNIKLAKQITTMMERMRDANF